VRKYWKKYPKNSKAMYRMSLSYSGINISQKAKEWIDKALEIEPNNKDIQQEAQKVQKKVDELNKQQKETYAKMFGFK